MSRPPDFVASVVAARDLVVTTAHEHAWRVEPRESALPWHCDLDDGTPTGESDPAPSITWVCPSLRAWRDASDVPQLDVHQPGPHSDLGRAVARIGSLLGWTSGRPAAAESRYVYTDPQEIIDDALRRRIEHWPTTGHGDVDGPPPQLWSIRVTRAGLLVDSTCCWGNAPAFDHQIGLAIDLADRLRARR